MGGARLNLGHLLVARGLVFGEAQVADVSFYVTDRVPKFVRRVEPPLLTSPPDIAVEILSPGQTLTELRAKLRHSLKHGSKLGWLIHPIREEFWVLRRVKQSGLESQPFTHLWHRSNELNS